MVVHYTCIGFTRNTVEIYKKIDGLKWQCKTCSNEFKVIWTKLEELVSCVSEIKSMINLCGMVKTAIDEAFQAKCPNSCSSEGNTATHPDHHKQTASGKTVKRQPPKKKKKKPSKSSTPVSSTFIQTTTPQTQSNQSAVKSSIESVTDTVIQADANDGNSTHGIRTVETRTYLWLNGFHHETTTSQVIKLVASTMSIHEAEIICRSLKSGRRTYTDLDQVSFRVGVRTTDLADALTTNRWPKGVVCKMFK